MNPPGIGGPGRSHPGRLLNDQHLARTLGARAACKAAAEYEVSTMVRRYRSMYDAILTPPII